MDAWHGILLLSRDLTDRDWIDLIGCKKGGFRGAGGCAKIHVIWFRKIGSYAVESSPQLDHWVG